MAGGRPKFSAPGEYGMPEDTAGKARDWAEGEDERERKKQEFMGNLAAFNKDPLAVLGGG